MRKSALVFLVFFAIYASSAQRGLGWGDSGEFQHWILGGADPFALRGFSNIHPLYIWICRAICTTPFHVALISAFFGALSVAGLCLCTNSAPLAVAFGFSHMLWWLSSLAEVQTMNLAICAFATLFFLKYFESGKGAHCLAAAFLAGLELECHNFALLLLPVFFAFALSRRASVKLLVLSALTFCLGASYWLWALFTRGVADVLVGAYGAKVAGFWPLDAKAAAFNYALAAISFVPLTICALARTREAAVKPSAAPTRMCAFVLFCINALFVARYFVPDQATFILPTLFFAYIAFCPAGVSWRRAIIASFAGLASIVAAFALLAHAPQDTARTKRHPGRDDARYFAFPWKAYEDSAARCAASLGLDAKEWDGYNMERISEK